MFQFSQQTNFYKGKVRDVYTIANQWLVMQASNRISAFDVILPTEIPYKGQVLNQVAAHFLNATTHIVPNWLMAMPAPNISAGLACTTYPVEMVVRGCLSGHAWRTYKSGERTLCGLTMPDGMKENDFFEQPIITPTTKAHEGHDEDISREQIIATGLIPENEYVQLETIAKAIFAKGQAMAKEQGLILVDTKYEFGKIGDTIYLIDEIHTPDSSRYFYADTYLTLQQQGLAQRQLSKEFVREWLIANNFQGKEGQTVPHISEAFATEISERYIELFEKITGKQFVKTDVSNEQIVANVENWITENVNV
jgi:phosphoribosylaminoimidazole-succinocarboxamide synthase